MTRRALDLLSNKRNDAYEVALAALREDTQAWCADLLARDPDDMKKELARPLIREQAFCKTLDPDKLERLGRYEVHLDRKLERMLAMLLRLKALR